MTRKPPGRTLSENMILAEDIQAEEGILLLRQGTRLSRSMIERLRDLAAETGSRNYLWICDPV